MSKKRGSYHNWIYKILDVIEDCRNEFKVKLPNDLEETVIGFLNSKDGGNIYLGVDDNREIIGLKNNVDLLQRKIKNLIVSNIEPSVIGLFDIEVLYYKKIVISGSSKLQDKVNYRLDYFENKDYKVLNYQKSYERFISCIQEILYSFGKY